jgi:PAS domain S-box-containing protein
MSDGKELVLSGPRAEDPGFLRAVAHMAQELAGVSSLDELGPAIDRVISGFLDVEVSGFFLLEPGGNHLRLIFSRGFSPEEERLAAQTAWERHPGHVLRTGKVLHVPDTRADPSHLTSDSPRRVAARSRLFQPVLLDDRVVGTIGLSSSRPHAFDDLALAVLSYAASLVAIVYGRLEAEHSRRADQQRLQAVVTDQTELICRFQPDGALTFVNDAYCRYFGRTAQELIGRTFAPMIVEEDVPRMVEARASLRPDRPVVTYEHRTAPAEGRTRWQQWTDRAFFDEAGVLREFQSVGRDITDLMEAQRTAAESEEYFRQVVDNGDSVFYLIDLQETPRILYLSAAFEAVVGRPVAAVLADSREYFDHIHPEDRKLFWDHVQEETPRTGHGAIEYRILRPDGSIRWLRDRSFRTRSGTAATQRVAGFVQDITDERMASELLTVERDLAIAMASTSDLQEALTHVLDAALRIERIDGCGIYLLDPDSGALQLAAHRGLSEAFVAQAGLYAPGTDQAHLAGEGKTRVVAVHGSAKSGLRTDALAAEGLRIVVVTPVHCDGHVVAVLNLASRSPAALPPYTLDAIETIAAQIGGIVARIQSEAELARSRRNLQTLFDSIDDFLFVLDTRGGVRQVNTAVRQILGWPDEELVGKNFLMLHPERHRTEALATLGEMLEGRVASCPLPILARDGREIPVDTKVTRGVWDGQDALFGISRDMTRIRAAEAQLLRAKDELEKAVQQRTAELRRTNTRLEREIEVRRGAEKELRHNQGLLRQLASDASLAEERERRRIATEIHDRLGQLLSLARIRLDMVESSHPKAETPGRYDELGTLLDRALDDIHTLTFELSPPILYEVGFDAALEWIAEDVGRRAGLVHELVVGPTPRELPFDLKVLLFQVARELLTNVVKHAGAASFRVETGQTRGFAFLAVADDGKGFAPREAGAEPSRKGGFGLFSIRERMTHLGGRMSVESAPGDGTRVLVEVPLRVRGTGGRKRHDTDSAGG